MEEYRILVCGSRYFDSEQIIRRSLDQIISLRAPTKDILIINGAARGADKLATKYAISKQYRYEECPADWKNRGKAAGVIRNQDMLDEYKPHLVVAFPFDDSVGTQDMIDRSRAAGVSVLIHKSVFEEV